MEARLPLDKVEKIRAQLLDNKCKKSVTLKELQSLLGLLNFACSVIIPGGQASSPSIFSYISAISFYHKSARLPDPTASFFIRKILKGVANSIPSSPDARLPITIDILTRLVAAIPVVMGEGFDVASYTSHSFRIGAATNAATNGVPEPVIRELGRWKSDAFKRYIRINPAGTGRH
ncbi:uncharacterized protein LOC141910317 [Tubulanus polymorphus]|uniref:uncharacterized protein LOC141910317 n=1 Tax=Tubulanus polymorphus TaxID=672921 RepID=UPI003DA2CBD8